MQTAFNLEIKAMSEDGTFEGLASTYGPEPDEGNDLCMPGCFTKTLASGKTRPLLVDHRDPVGTVDLQDSPQGLKAKGRLALGVQKARETYELMKAGAIKGLSIGYTSQQADYVGNVRQLKELKLYEVSLTALPMNQAATITSVKSQDLAMLRDAIAELKSLATALGKKN